MSTFSILAQLCIWVWPSYPLWCPPHLREWYIKLTLVRQWKQHEVQHVPLSHITLHKHVFDPNATKINTLPTCWATCDCLDAAGVTYHVGAGACKRHELGVELQAGDRPRVLPIQQRHLHSALCVPHVDLSVLWAWRAKTLDVLQKNRSDSYSTLSLVVWFSSLVQWVLWTINDLLVSVKTSSLLAFICCKLWKLSETQ